MPVPPSAGRPPARRRPDPSPRDDGSAPRRHAPRTAQAPRARRPAAAPGGAPVGRTGWATLAAGRAAVACGALLATLAAGPLGAQAPSGPAGAAESDPVSERDGRTTCARTAWLEPESLQGHEALLRRLPGLDGLPTPSRTWSTAASLGRIPVCADAPWLRGWTAEREAEGLLPATARTNFNSAFPVERNNGLQWAGRGLSGVARAGARWSRGRLTLQLRPVVAVAENRDFAVPVRPLEGRSEHAYPWWRNIDWPVRHGTGSLLWLGPGESRLALELGPMEAALSTEQQVWGPALRYPLLLGAGAPGFPHLAVSTGRPLRLGGFASLELRLLWGVLEESEHFDLAGGNDRRLLGGAVASIQPSLLPGFTVGAASLVHSGLEDLEAADLLNFVQAPTQDVAGNVDGNGMGALFARWAVPGSGFEAFVEWARDDYASDLDLLVSEPDRARALTLGVQQVGRWGDRLLRLHLETTRLTADEPDIEQAGLARAVFYTHAEVPQGHTHRGQLLGAAVGPGSDAQYLAVDVLGPGGNWGGWVERVRWDDDAYVRQMAPRYGRDGHDVELGMGLRHARPVGALRVSLEASARLRRNRHFHNLVGTDPDFPWETNGGLEATVSWVPGG